jgi:hypothetical protein
MTIFRGRYVASLETGACRAGLLVSLLTGMGLEGGRKGGIPAIGTRCLAFSAARNMNER